MIAEQRFERLAISLDPIWPVIIAHQRAVAILQRCRPGNHEVRCKERCASAISAYRKVLCFLKGCNERTRDPRMLIVEIAPDHHRMHDRENVRPAKIVALDSLVILEEATDFRRPGA